jgi:glycine hydroxymethyltransferase
VRNAQVLTCNRNLVPGDTTGPTVTSGLRFGTSAVTTRGFRRTEMTVVAGLIADVLDELLRSPTGNTATERLTAEIVGELTAQFPIALPGSATWELT